MRYSQDRQEDKPDCDLCAKSCAGVPRGVNGDDSICDECWGKAPTIEACRFCQGLIGLSLCIDTRNQHLLRHALELGSFWCCGMCYARVLNAAYSNMPPCEVCNHAEKK